jgi:hypothetical protein
VGRGRQLAGTSVPQSTRPNLVSAHEDLPPGSDHVPRLAADDGAGRCDRCLHLVDEGALFEG